jgi:hypothetical protein
MVCLSFVVLVIWPTIAGVQQPNVRTLTEQELLDMMMGSSIQASRGNNTTSMVRGCAWDYVRERVKKQNLPTIPNSSAKAIEALSKHVGKKFNAWCAQKRPARR